MTFDLSAFVQAACGVQLTALPRSMQLLIGVSCFRDVSLSSDVCKPLSSQAILSTPPLPALSTVEMANILSQTSRLSSSISAAINGSQNPVSTWAALGAFLNVSLSPATTNSTGFLSHLPSQ